MNCFQRVLFFCLTLAPVVSGCDWRKLDEAVENAPVRSTEAPSDYLGTDVGRLVVALPPPDDKPEVSARFLVASVTKVAAALIDVDRFGKTTAYNVPDTVLAPLAGQPATALAAAAPRPDEGVPSVLIGTARFKVADIPFGGVFRLLIQPGPTFRLADQQVQAPLTLAGDPATGAKGFGRGVATGNVSGLPQFEDWVIQADFGVTLVEDGALAVLTPASRCLVAPDLNRALIYQRGLNPAIGDFIPELPGGEIAVGVPAAAGAGAVVLLSRQPAELDCPLSISVPGLPTFGSSVAAGFVNADAFVDLVVGAPPSQVLVFLGPFNPAVPPVPAVVFTAPPDATQAEFGARVALIEADGVPGLEVAIAAPAFPASGTLGAGAVYLYNVNAPALPFAVVTDHDPEANAGLGEGLAVVPVRNASCVQGAVRHMLVAGANEEVFSYYKLPGALPDIRCLTP
ncbi:MAG: hypothetical protein KA712_22270 [Myxococcales bacterium]|nr:hypothetical protein [Myxococcales bacterium]